MDKQLQVELLIVGEGSKNFGEFLYRLYKDPYNGLQITFPDWKLVKEFVYANSIIINLKKNKGLSKYFDELIIATDDLKNAIEGIDNSKTENKDYYQITTYEEEYLDKYYTLIQNLFHHRFFEDDNSPVLVPALRSGFVENIIADGCSHNSMWTPETLESLKQFYTTSQWPLYNISQSSLKTFMQQYLHTCKIRTLFKNSLSKKGNCKGRPWVYNYEFGQERYIKPLLPTTSISPIPLNFVLNKVGEYINTHSSKQLSVAIVGTSWDEEEWKDFANKLNQLYPGVQCEVVVYNAVPIQNSYKDKITIFENQNHSIKVVKKECDVFFNAACLISLIDEDIVFFTNTYCMYKSKYRYTDSNNKLDWIFEKREYKEAFGEAVKNNHDTYPIGRICNAIEIMSHKRPTDVMFSYDDLVYFKMNMDFFTLIKEWTERFKDKHAYLISSEKESMLYEPNAYRDYMKTEFWNNKNFYVWEFGGKKTLRGNFEDLAKPTCFSSTFTFYDLLSHIEADVGSLQLLENLKDILNPEVSSSIVLQLNYYATKEYKGVFPDGVPPTDLHVQIQYPEGYLDKYSTAVAELEKTIHELVDIAFVNVKSRYTEQVYNSFMNTMENAVESLDDAIQCSFFKNCYSKILYVKSKPRIIVQHVNRLEVQLEKPLPSKSVSLDYVVIDNWIKLITNTEHHIPVILSMFSDLSEKVANVFQKYNIPNLERFFKKLSILYIEDFQKSSLGRTLQTFISEEKSA